MHGYHVGVRPKLLQRGLVPFFIVHFGFMAWHFFFLTVLFGRLLDRLGRSAGIRLGTSGQAWTLAGADRVVRQSPR